MELGGKKKKKKVLGKPNLVSSVRFSVGVAG